MSRRIVLAHESLLPLAGCRLNGPAQLPEGQWNAQEMPLCLCGSQLDEEAYPVTHL